MYNFFRLTFHCIAAKIRRSPYWNRANIYLFKISNRNTRCEICLNITIKTPESRRYRRSGVFIVNFIHISHLFQVFPLLTLQRVNVMLGMFLYFGHVFITFLKALQTTLKNVWFSFVLIYCNWTIENFFNLWVFVFEKKKLNYLFMWNLFVKFQRISQT